MELLLKRNHGTSGYTAGKLYIGEQFECYTLEDQERPQKMPGQTAIPLGRYQVLITFSNRFQKPLPLLLNVPDSPASVSIPATLPGIRRDAFSSAQMTAIQTMHGWGAHAKHSTRYLSKSRLPLQLDRRSGSLSPDMSIDTSKHLRLGNGLTAEVLRGIVILFRVHEDPDEIPGDLKEAFVAHQPAGDEFVLIERGDEKASALFHENEEQVREFKAYVGQIGTLSQRRVVEKFLEYLNLGGAKVERPRRQDQSKE